MFSQMANYLNEAHNSKQVIVLRISDVTGVTTSNSYLLWNLIKQYFSGASGKTGLSDYKHRTGRWPTLQEAVNENKRVFVIAGSDVCNSNCFTSNRWIISNTNMGDTWQTRKITSSCSGIVSDTAAQCESKKDKTFILDSHFGSSGLCTWDMAGLCDNYLKSSVDACAAVRSGVGKSVNFIIVDWPNKSSTSESVVTIANQQNVKNVARLGL